MRWDREKEIRHRIKQHKDQCHYWRVWYNAEEYLVVRYKSNEGSVSGNYYWWNSNDATGKWAFDEFSKQTPPSWFDPTTGMERIISPFSEEEFSSEEIERAQEIMEHL